MNKSDIWIRSQSVGEDSNQLLHVDSQGQPMLDSNGDQIKGMIYPFVEKQKGQGVVSYGLDSYGYDIRVRPEYKYPDPRMTCHDPHDPLNSTMWVPRVAGDVIVIPPNGGQVLVESVERFNIPRNIQCRTVGKSTYTSRLGLIVCITDIEPEYQGTLTFTLLNPTKLPIRVYVNQGIASVKFSEGDPCESSYKDKGGKYQGSTGIQTAKIKETQD